MPGNDHFNRSRMCGAGFFSGVLISGVAVEVPLAGCSVPASVWVDPASGDSITVTYKHAVEAPSQLWPNGVVALYSSDVMIAPLYSVTFQRTGGSGVTSRFGISQ